MHSFEVGDTVTVTQTGYHRMDGKTGVVVYVRGTVGVSFDGDVYGFRADELIPAVSVTADDVKKELAELDGSNAAVVSLMTGYSREELKDLGGVPEEPKVPREELVDLLLEYSGVPRHYLYEYPYRADESDAIIGKAEDVLDAILEKLGVEL